MESEEVTVNFGNFVQSSTIDYRKYVSSIFFLRGCNLNCYCCQNDEICRFQDIRQVGDIKKIIDDSCIFSSAIVFSGGECTLQGEALKELCKYSRERGFKVAIQTNGTKPEVIKSLVNFGYIDKVAMDVKTKWDEYSEFCNVNIDYTGDIKKSIEFCKKAKYDGKIEDFEIITTVFKKNIESVLDISYYFDDVDYVINNGVLEHSEVFKLEELVDACKNLNKNNRTWIRTKECGECEFKNGKLHLSNGMEYIE